MNLSVPRCERVERLAPFSPGAAMVRKSWQLSSCDYSALQSRPGGKVGALTAVESVGLCYIAALKDAGEPSDLSNVLDDRQVELAIAVCVALRIRGPMQGIAWRVQKIIDDLGAFPKVVEARGRFTLEDPMGLARHRPRPPVSSPPVHLVPAAKRIPKSLREAAARKEQEKLMATTAQTVERVVPEPQIQIQAVERVVPDPQTEREWGPRHKIRRAESNAAKEQRHAEADRLAEQWRKLEKVLADMAVSEDALDVDRMAAAWQAPRREPVGSSSSSSAAQLASEEDQP